MWLSLDSERSEPSQIWLGQNTLNPEHLHFRGPKSLRSNLGTLEWFSWCPPPLHLAILLPKVYASLQELATFSPPSSVPGWPGVAKKEKAVKVSRIFFWHTQRAPKMLWITLNPFRGSVSDLQNKRGSLPTLHRTPKHFKLRRFGSFQSPPRCAFLSLTWCLHPCCGATLYCIINVIKILFIL